MKNRKIDIKENSLLGLPDEVVNVVREGGLRVLGVVLDGLNERGIVHQFM
jgi:hypothetical protein